MTIDNKFNSIGIEENNSVRVHWNRWCTSAEFRSAVKAHYGLSDSDHGHLSMIGRILLSPPGAQSSNGRIKVPATTVKDYYRTKKASASDLLAEFERRTGIRLNLTSYNSRFRMSRRINPVVDSEVIALRDRELAIPYRDKKNPVHFVTGEDWTTHQCSKQQKQETPSVECRSATSDAEGNS